MSKRNHLKERLNEKIEAISFSTLVVGVDIAKRDQWARFVDCRGVEHGKALKFENNKNGFYAILTRIAELCKEYDFTNVVVTFDLSMVCSPFTKSLAVTVTFFNTQSIEASAISDIALSFSML